MLKFTHIINPVKVNETSDLFVAQPITFESMKRAKVFSENEIDVTLLSTQYEEDLDIIPDYFNKTPNLERSVLDFGVFNKKRKLPLIKDILEKAVNFKRDADYIIYTNVDIALMPHFYAFVSQKINDGFDAFVINRRTITAKYSKVEELPLMYTEIGVSHPGYDCFVFKRELFDKFILENVCIGVSKIGVTLLSNIFCFAKKYKIYKNEHLTFHIGEDKIWQNNDLNDYFIINKREALKAFEKLLQIDSLLNENKIFTKHINLLRDIKKENLQEIKLVERSFFQKISNKIKRFAK